MRWLPLVLLLLAGPAFGAEKVSSQSVVLPGGALPFSAAVETQVLNTPAGQAAAEVVVTSYVAAPGTGRPVTFAVNGGPGASSAWLQLGALGPWRVPVAVPVVPSQGSGTVDNAESWLPFTDLVFVDPPGTGFSRGLGKEDPERPFMSVDADVRMLATVMRRWLEGHGRLGSAVFIAGESYGGFRGPLLARALLEQQGVGVSGLVLISPVLDFNGRDAPYDAVRWAGRLPSLAARARGTLGREGVADVEAYAAGPYVVDLLRGPRDPAAVARVNAAVAGFTGVDAALVARRAGRLDLDSVLRAGGVVASPYDTTISAQDPFPAAARDNSPDPVLDGLRGPFTAAMLQVYRVRLGWAPEGAPNRQYELLNESVARGWDYGHGAARPEAMTALRQFLALDPTVRVLVTHGVTDLVTPYFADALLLDQVPDTVPAGRLGLRVYPGGHMSYLRADSRAALRDDAAALVRAVMLAREGAEAAAGAGTPPSPAPPSPPAPSGPATPR